MGCARARVEYELEFVFDARVNSRARARVGVTVVVSTMETTPVLRPRPREEYALPLRTGLRTWRISPFAVSFALRRLYEVRSAYWCAYWHRHLSIF